MCIRDRDGAILAKDGNSFNTLNWTGFSISGKQVVAEYKGKYDGNVFTRIELDNTGESDRVESNLYFDYKTNAQLSNVTFSDAELVGHDFKYKAGQEMENELLEDGRLKYAVSNKFVPFDYEYEVLISPLQDTVTMTPVAMSDRITALTVNGAPASSRCPVTVPASGPAVVTVTGPDGKTNRTYTFTFRTV